MRVWDMHAVRPSAELENVSTCPPMHSLILPVKRQSGVGSIGDLRMMRRNMKPAILVRMLIVDVYAVSSPMAAACDGGGLQEKLIRSRGKAAVD